MQLQILFEDDNYLAINKPQAMVCHATVDKNRENLLDHVLKKYPKIILIHRLDKDTSGVIFFAKNSEANRILSQLFAEHTVEKYYLAWVQGVPPSTLFEMNDFIKDTGDKSIIVKSGGKKAIAEVTLLQSLNGFSLLKIKLKTGRKHQIRVQLGHRNLPIVGDELYGSSAKTSMLLHCESIAFFDPISQKDIKVEALVPTNFNYFSSKMDFKYIAFNKPFNVLSQFQAEGDKITLSSFNFPKEVYPVGRLDYDSEGLLILSNDPEFVAKLLEPEKKVAKVYHVQVEGVPSEKQLRMLRSGVVLKDHNCLPAKVNVINPNYSPRSIPIRERKDIPTSWLEITIVEGKNRQVRRMTAAAGLPTLRLIRVQIGNYQLRELAIGEWSMISKESIIS